MSDLFSIDELVEITGGHAENISAEGVSSISIDSRTLKPGGLYVAIRGARFDGHGFVHKAVVNGAAAALVNQDKAIELAGLPLIIVPDALGGLEDIARAARARSNAKIVAITGSAGKTTTKSMVEKILGRAGQTHASIKSYNNHWGVPLMLASLPESAEYGVFEIGMNHGGEITPLVKLVRPHVALVTNVGSAHIGNFENYQGIAEAKAEILTGLEPGGVAIVNADHDFEELFRRDATQRGDIEYLTFGFARTADVGAFDHADTKNGSRGQARFGKVLVNFELSSKGKHMVSNAVGALCVARALGVDFGLAVQGLADFTSSEGRGQVFHYTSGTRTLVLMDESYNANPASMKAVLEVFGGMDARGGAKVLVLGDMLELGLRSHQLHMDLLDHIVESGAEKVFLVGEQMLSLKNPLAEFVEVEWAENSEQIAHTIALGLDYGDVVMVKGSLGIAL
ncbi:MAG TPA: UDP-N-acetylmuramoyl-tripeptide--D-alanyl-D-alanine ligase, partial [Devosia sp.]|nr:UDP-N-acetylmuramoyl-tripeptide--D-alanyl-D-alanine ligase [Devosia sp.]